MIMKRGREEADLDSIAIAKCLMLLSRVGKTPTEPKSPERLFSCKTCNKQFSSFRALGGHRASHKRPRLTTPGDLSTAPFHQGSPPAKTKSHECSICGLEFALGQALGGHMRRHRPAADKSTVVETVEKVVPVLRRMNSKRVMGLDLNLSLMPYVVEDDLELDLKLGHERFGYHVFNNFV